MKHTLTIEVTSDTLDNAEKEAFNRARTFYGYRNFRLKDGHTRSVRLYASYDDLIGFESTFYFEKI